MGGKEGVVEGTEQRGELSNSPGGTVKGLWFRKRTRAVGGSPPSQEHPCTWRFLRRGLPQPYEGHSPSLKMEKPRLRNVKPLAQGHRADREPPFPLP